MKTELFVASQTDVGLEREINEDSVRVATTADGSSVLIVCDGMGGHAGGDLASRVAANTLIASLVAGARSPVHEAIAGALIRANDEVHDAARKLGAGRMGTTAVVAWVNGERFWLGWAGDSRLYHLRDGEILFRTADHTRVQEMIDHGILDPQDARSHVDAHMLTVVLGGDPDAPAPFEPSVYGQPFALQPKDLLLLCSDGLTDEIEDHELAPLIEGLEVEAAAARLIEEANARGGRDNISVIVGVSGQQEVPRWSRQRGSKPTELPRE